MKLHRIKSILARISVFIFLIVVLWGCGRVPSLIEEKAMPASRLPFVRVLMENGSRQHTISVPNGGQMAIECYKDGNRYSYYSRRPVIVQGEKKKIGLYDGAGHNLDYNIDRVVISPRGKDPMISYDDKKYRGLLEISSSSGQIVLINIVYMEDYLKGVVPLEIGPTPESQIEAVKAQAVAARTYSMSHLDQYGEAGYDLKSDISDQVYGGVHVENKIVNKAIAATRGEVAVYHDRMINAYYHSTCGGTTDDIEDVWDKDAEPYLVSVEDDHACEVSKYFTWTDRFTADQLVMRLEMHLARERGNETRVGRLTDIRITNRTPGGRVASITFETTGGHFIFNKEQVRWVVKRSDDMEAILRSANFTIDIERDADGAITEVIFNGRGYGHGVGMCQMGARGLADRGVSYDSILSLYYQGTNLKKLY